MPPKIIPKIPQEITIIIGEIEKIPIAIKVNKKIKIFIFVSAVFLTIFITVFKTRAETAILIPAKACWIINKWENSFKKFAWRSLLQR